MTEWRRSGDEWVSLAADALVGLFNALLVSIVGGPTWAALMTALITFQILQGRRA